MQKRRASLLLFIGTSSLSLHHAFTCISDISPEVHQLESPPLPVLQPVLLRYTAKVRGSCIACQEGEEQFSLLVQTLWLCTYLPVSMEDREGQHMGVVTKALVKVAPPCSIILLVLFMTCRDPGRHNFSTGQQTAPHEHPFTSCHSVTLFSLIY